MMTAHLTEAEAADLARRVGESMYAADEASKDTMGMELLACQPGRASMRMVVRPLHLNGHKICHGGFIFTLADSTFAYACNSRNHATVANGCSIEFLRPAHEGDVLTAEGVEQRSPAATASTTSASATRRARRWRCSAARARRSAAP